MALFISTMIMLFAFTTNIGMLVHAKINLQNAADAAAYAGAAVQARQLTAAAYLNYEMRRALKEFLFLAMVRSQYSAMPCFPADASGQPPVYGSGVQCPGVDGEARHDFAFFDPRETGNNEQGGPFIPTTCIIFSPDNNYCQKDSVPGIPEFQGSGSFGVADPIVAAVKNATNQIISKKVADCLGRTEINQQFLIAWLFNVYPYQDASSAATLVVGQDSDDPFDAVGMERLGVLPRMAILRARIDNFEEALNLNLGTEGVGGLTITDDSISAIKTAGAGKIGMGMDYFERPVQAFLSARNNLPTVARDNGIFSEIELSELIPNRIGNVSPNPDLANAPVLVKFNDIVAPASFANSRFEELPVGSNGALRGNCKQYREKRTINSFPYGITKDPNVLTYYAVRLQAKARLLFSPFGTDGTVTLSAYSAAKPFGSRIGRDLSLDPDNLMQARASDGFSSIITGDSPVHPNILVADDDRTSSRDGFARRAHLGYLRGVMLTFNRRDYGMRLAGAYAPWEVGYYTPPANFQIPETIGLFSDNPFYEGKYFKLTAPLFPVNGGAGTGLGFIRERILRYIAGAVTGTQTLENQPQFRAFKEFMLSDAMFSILFDFMDQNRLVNTHIIPDPLLNDQPDILNYARAVGQRFTVAGMQSPQRRQLTSWNTQKTASDVDNDVSANSELGPNVGRSGYSVRFISFNSLKAGGAAGNDPLQPGSWDNPFNRLDAGGAAARIQDDLTKVKH